MKRPEQLLDGLIVVDAHSQDYEPLVGVFDLNESRISLFATGEQALRSANGGSSQLWIVNVKLPDMSGIGFLKLIRRRMRRSSVFLVGDYYSASDELAARSAGATAYFCKPPSAAWLQGYLLPGWMPAIRVDTESVNGSAAAMRPP